MGNQEPSSRLCSNWVLCPHPNPSMQSLAIPSSVAWQPGIYLKGRPHSNTYHKPALPAPAQTPLQFSAPTPSETETEAVLLCLPLGPKPILFLSSTSLQTLKALGRTVEHTLVIVLFNRMEDSCRVHRSCQPARLKNLLGPGPPGHSPFMGTYVQDPRSQCAVRQGLLSG